MKTFTRKQGTAGLMFVLVLGVLGLYGADFLISIDVAPNVLNLQNQGEVVTVHTDIPYSSVDGSEVSLNGVVISHWKSDNRGYFVAKFNMEDIKDLPLDIDRMNTLKLEGITNTGLTFEGSQDILVIDVLPKGR